MAAPPTDYDSPWKEALEYYLEDFLALLAPWLHEQIDWQVAPVFLDKELQAVTRDAHTGRRYADKLVRLKSKTQHPIWILIHIEVQGGEMSAVSLELFGERMFQYFYRISDHHQRILIAPDGTHRKTELISLGVLTASASKDTCLLYSQDSLNACSVQFSFPVVHLASWLSRWSELEQQALHNPFAVVVMALPAELEPAFEQAMIAIEQEHKMTFVTSIERLGEKRGLEKGMEKGMREGEASLLQRLLVRKFGPLPEALQQRIKSATPNQLEAWSLNILDAHTLAEVFTE